MALTILRFIAFTMAFCFILGVLVFILAAYEETDAVSVTTYRISVAIFKILTFPNAVFNDQIDLGIAWLISAAFDGLLTELLLITYYRYINSSPTHLHR